MKYSIVIPAYNESDKITSTLTQIISFMNEFTDKYEVIVVDDGSSDNTVEIVEKYMKDYPQVRIIKNPHRGKGPAVYSGVMSAEGELIYLCDADLSTPISEIKKLSSWIIDQGYDIVIASREGVGSQRINEPFYRHLMGRVFNLWVQMLALRGIKDSQCGFKLFKKNVAKDIFSRLSIYGESAKEISKPYLGAFDVEVLYLARKLNYSIKELPVSWTYVNTIRLNPLRDSYNMALDVLKVRINDLRGVYKVKKGTQ